MSHLEQDTQQIRLFDAKARPPVGHVTDLSASLLQTAEHSGRGSNRPKQRSLMQSEMTYHTTAAATAVTQSITLPRTGNMTTNQYSTNNPPSAEPKTKFIRKGDSGRFIGGFD